MKIFTTVLMAAIALTTADISLQPGYNYRVQQPPLIMQILTGPVQQQSHAKFQQAQLNQLPFTQPSNHYLPHQQQKYHAPQHVATVMTLPMHSSLGGFQPKHSVRRPRPRVKIPKKPIISKSYFIHQAPEETEEDIQEELAHLAQTPRKHYNVLFVKAPTQTNKAAALTFAKSVNEEKTVVYVLNKKTSASDLQSALDESPQRINKPEVFFIKYRTPEEAANAQQQIQSQYDSLGGSTTISDEGVAPVTSVVGSLDAPEEEEIEEQPQNAGEQAQQQQFDDQTLANNINQYLPPSQF